MDQAALVKQEITSNEIKHTEVKTEEYHIEIDSDMGYCDNSFSHKSVLVEHGKSHTGQKTFQCNNCNKSFSRRSILEDHQRKD